MYDFLLFFCKQYAVLPVVCSINKRYELLQLTCAPSPPIKIPGYSFPPRAWFRNPCFRIC